MVNRNSITLGPSSLTIRPRGLDRFWSLRKHLEVPYKLIRGTSVEDHPRTLGLTHRLGLDLGTKRSGSFFPPTKRLFVNTSGKGKILCLELDPSFEFTEVLLSIDSPEEWSKRILSRTT